MIIVDTGAFLALLNKRDTHHQAARQAFSKVSEPLITTYPVITETCYLLVQLTNLTVQRKFLNALCQDVFEIFQLERHHLERMTHLMEQYENLPIGRVWEPLKPCLFRAGM